MWNKIRAALIAVIFIACVALVVIGQKHIGVGGLCVMLVGLAGLLMLLWRYNRGYR